MFSRLYNAFLTIYHKSQIPKSERLSKYIADSDARTLLYLLQRTAEYLSSIDASTDLNYLWMQMPSDFISKTVQEAYDKSLASRGWKATFNYGSRINTIEFTRI